MSRWSQGGPSCLGGVSQSGARSPATPNSQQLRVLHFQGISQAARYVYRRLVNDGILSQAFSIAPVRFRFFLPFFGLLCCLLSRRYPLLSPPGVPATVVGHSLGAGAAALLALMLKARTHRSGATPSPRPGGCSGTPFP